MSIALAFRSILCALAVLGSLSAVSTSFADEIEAEDWIVRDADVPAIARRAEDSLRAARTFMRARVTIQTSKRSKPRALEFECWTDRVGRRSRLRVLSPRSAAGVAYLYLPPNLWHYDPELERTQLAMPSVLLDAWMDSDFALGDLLDPSSAVDDYEIAFLEVAPPSADTGGQRSYVLQYTPRPTARVVWSKILAWIGIDAGAPLRKEFYSATGEKLRTLRFGDIRDVGGRHVPHRWTATASGEKQRQSVLEIRELRFEPGFDDAIFSTRNLRPDADTASDG